MTGTPTAGQPAAPAQPVEPGRPAPAPGRDEEPSRWNQAIRDIMGGPVIISILAVVLALIVGAILIAITDPGVPRAAGYFFARPGDTFQAIWTSVSRPGPVEAASRLRRLASLRGTASPRKAS